MKKKNLTLSTPSAQNGPTHSNNLPTNCLNVFHHFMGLGRKGLTLNSLSLKTTLYYNEY